MVFRSLAILFGLFWVYCAIFNGIVAWRVHVRRIARGPSAAPLVGGICAFLGLLLWPIASHSGGRTGFIPWKALGAALLLDYGSLGVFVIAGLLALREAGRRE
jgi:hypothetical protein